MAITVKFLEELGIESETAKKIFAERSSEVEREKAKLAAVQAELSEKTAAFDTLNSEMEALKTSNASAEDWKTKFEALQADNIAKEKQAEAERILKEKNDNISNRFNTALGEKKFYNDPTREYYFKKFGEAIEAEENQGKSDADVLHNLTKDDDKAFQGVEVVKLAGGKPLGTSSGKYTSREEIFNIRDATTRQNEMLNHPDLFPEIQI